MDLPRRTGPTPQTSIEGPQSQLTENSSPELWGRLIHLAITEHNVIEGISSVSLRSSRAIFFRDLHETKVPWTSLAPAGKQLEPVHIHGVHDTSIHLCLPTDRAQELVALGWGVMRPHSDFDTEILVYGPRDKEELRIVLGFIRESLTVARALNS
jgi:hypothetical protein